MRLIFQSDDFHVSTWPLYRSACVLNDQRSRPVEDLSHGIEVLFDMVSSIRNYPGLLCSSQPIVTAINSVWRSSPAVD